MTSAQRKAAYAALLFVNAAMLVGTQQALFPASWASAVHAVSLVVAMLMKEFSAADAAPGLPEAPKDGAPNA